MTEASPSDAPRSLRDRVVAVYARSPGESDERLVGTGIAGTAKLDALVGDTLSRHGAVVTLPFSDLHADAAVDAAALVEDHRILAWDEMLWFAPAPIGPLGGRLFDALDTAFERWCAEQADDVYQIAQVLRSDGMPIEDIPAAATALAAG